MGKVLFTSLALITVFLFFKPLNSYFSQDDFFHLRIIQDKSLKDIPSFFYTYLPDQTFYRPLSREVFNTLLFKIFGLSALIFHLINLTVILVNGFLALIIFKRMAIKKIAVWISLAIYFFHSVHSIELYYLASIQTLLATTFSLLAIYFYLNFCQKKLKKTYLLALMMFALSLLSHESATTLPVILVLINLFIYGIKMKNLKNILVTIAPFLLFSLLRGFFLIFLNSLPSQLVYEPNFSPNKVLNTFVWFSLWNFGLPEILVDFIGPGIKVNPNLSKWYSPYLKIVLPSLIIIFSILIDSLVKFIKQDVKRLFLILLTFILSLAPFLFFPQHKFVYYLSFSSIWFSLFIGLSLERLKGKLGKILIGLFLILFLTISWQTNRLNEDTYWAAKRAKAAKYLLSKIKQKYPILEKGTTFYFKNDPNYPVIAKEWGGSSRQAFYILSGSDGLKLLYNDSSIESIFEEINHQEIASESGRKVFEVMATFPY